MSLKSLFTD